MFFTSRSKQCGSLATALVILLPLSAAAQQEPFGQDIDGWRFTQDFVNGSALCRAFSPGPTSGVVIQRRASGQYFVAVPAKNLRKGLHEGANFEVGGASEPINPTSDGNFLYMPLDDHMVGEMVKAGGFDWAVQGRKGSAVFTGALGKAVARLRACTKANGGR